MAFEDLLLPNAQVLIGEYFPYTVDTSFYLPLAVEDPNAGSVLMDFSSGFTATMTLNLPDDTDVLEFSSSPVAGRVINLNPATDAASLIVQSTPAGMGAVEPFARRALAFNLIVTRSSDGMAVDLMRDCYIVPQPAHD